MEINPFIEPNKGELANETPKAYKQIQNMDNTSQTKKWTETKADSSWSIFKIMSEFVEGYEKLNKLDPCVSIFGSARTQPDNPYYQLGVDVAKLFVENGFGIITGGGPGIMEAANKGAKEAKGSSVGLGIDLPFEQGVNEFVDHDKELTHRYFFVRKVMFVKYAQAFIVLPGGFGTLDELFECITLIQTKKIERIPVVLMGKDFWGGLIDWIKETLLETHGNISEKDLKLFHLTDDPQDAWEYINDFYQIGTLRPNF